MRAGGAGRDRRQPRIPSRFTHCTAQLSYCQALETPVRAFGVAVSTYHIALRNLRLNSLDCAASALSTYSKRFLAALW